MEARLDLCSDWCVCTDWLADKASENKLLIWIMKLLASISRKFAENSLVYVSAESSLDGRHFTLEAKTRIKCSF